MDKSQSAALTLLVYGMAGILSICSWNMRSLTPAGPYINTLANDNDIIIGSEHRLYNCELYRLNDFLPGYQIHAKASADVDQEIHTSKSGHCGIFIARQDALSSNIRIIDVNSDRICAIQMGNVLNNTKCNLYIIGVYLPHQQCRIADF